MSTEKLRVLQVTGVMNRGGAEVMLMDVYRHISPNVQFDFLINTKARNPRPIGKFDEEIRRRGGRLLYIGSQWEMGIAAYVARFKRIVQETGTPDVVHIHLNAKCGVIALAAKLCGVPKIIAHSHAALRFTGPALQAWPSIAELKLQKLLIALFATDYWGCSQAANESLFYPRLHRTGRTIVIKNAIDVTAFQRVSKKRTGALRNVYEASEGALILGNVGRVVRHKRVDFIVDVLRILAERQVEFQFVFAGREDDPAYVAEIFAKAMRYGVRDRICLLGEQRDIPTLMSTFDLFVGPAQNEGFGLVAAEAQAAGIPCVLSTGFPQEIDMGLDLVEFVEDDSPQQWADAIMKMRDAKCLNAARIREQFIRRGFDAAENTRCIERLYRASCQQAWQRRTT